MTTLQTLTLFIMPVGATIIGLIVYYQAMSEARAYRQKHHK